MTAIRLPLTHARALRSRARHAHHLPRAFGAALCTAALLTIAPLAFADTHPTGVTAETLVKSTAAWDQTGYTAYPAGTPEPTLVRITLAPNTPLDWHTHPMPAIGYVTSGQLTVERADNGVQRAFTAGQTITELVDVAHRGWAGDTGAELLVFYAGAAQQPLSVKSPDPRELALDERVKQTRD